MYGAVVGAGVMTISSYQNRHAPSKSTTCLLTQYLNLLDWIDPEKPNPVSDTVEKIKKFKRS